MPHTTPHLIKNVDQNKICAKLFVGTKISIDLRKQLNNSIRWKEITQKIALTESDLTELSHANDYYIGFTVNHHMSTLDNIQKIADEVRQKIESYCKNFNANKCDIEIFPVVFVK